MFLSYLFIKDVRRLKYLLSAWISLILIQSALGISGMNWAANNIEFQMFFPIITKLIDFMQGMMIIVIVPLLIHDDSLVGTTAFWFTRPISRKGLLITKAFFTLTLLIFLPFLSEIFVLLANDVNIHQVLLAVPEILIGILAFIIPFFILAALTPRFSRYALVGVIIFAVYVALIILGSIYSMLSPSYSKVFSEIFYNVNDPSLELSVEVAKNVYIIIFGFILIAYQFLTGYTARTVKGIAVAFFVMVCITRLWHWDFLKDIPEAKNSVAMSYPISLGFDSNSIIATDEFNVSAKGSRTKTISAVPLIYGLSSDQFAILSDLKNIEMKFPDGAILKSKSVLAHTTAYPDEKFMPAVQAALKDTKLLNRFIGNSHSVEVFNLDEQDFNLHKDKPGLYSAHAYLDIYKYKISSTIPLRKGAKDLFGSEQVIIYDVLEKPSGISVVIGEKRTNLIFDKKAKKVSQYDIARDLYSGFDHVYLIINKKRGEAFLAEISENISAAMMAMYGRSRLETNTKLFNFVYVNDRSGSLPEINKEWINNAEFVRMDAVKIVSLDKDFEVNSFLLPSKSRVVNTEEKDFDRYYRE